MSANLTAIFSERWLYYTVEQERDQYRDALVAILERQCSCVWDEARTDCACGADAAPRQIARRALTDRPAPQRHEDGRLRIAR